MSETAPVPVPPAKPSSGGEGSILTVVLVYAIFSALWILLSDRALVWLVRDPSQIALLSTLKGWVFVAVTSLLLYQLMRRLLGERRSRTEGGRPRAVTLPVLLFGLAILGLMALGIVNSARQQKAKEAANLMAIADLQTRQLADWVGERKGDMAFAQTSRLWAEAFHRWKGQGDVKSSEFLIGRLRDYLKLRGFQAAHVLDESGTPFWDSDPSASGSNAALIAEGRVAAERGQGGMLGPYRDEHGSLHLDFFAVLRHEGASRGPVLVLHADPANHLFRLIETWPVPSRTGESLLFRRDGDQVLFLNNLRHRKDSAVQLRLPLADSRLLAAQVLTGTARPGEPFEGVDYRGAQVMGVVHRVPGTDWFLLAKIDRSEVLGGAGEEVAWMGLSGLLAGLILLAGAFLFKQRRELAASLREQNLQLDRLQAMEVLHGISSASPDAMFAKDLRGTYLVFNPQAATLAGRPASEVIGRKDQDFWPQEMAERFVAQDREVIEGNRILSWEQTLATPLGSRIVLATKGPLRNSAGEVTGTFGISRDITELKQAERSLRNSEARFQDVAKASADWIWELDGECRFTYASESVEDLLGFRPEELLGRTPFDLMRIEDSEQAAAVFAELYSRKAGFRDVQNIHRHKDGSLRFVSSNGTPVLDPEGRLLGFRGLDRDVTAQKQAEAEQKRLQAEFLQAQKMESIGRLAGGVAHDFNNMLGVIVAHADLALIRGNPGESLRTDLEEIKRTAQRSADLTRQLLAFARKQTIAPQVLNLNEVIVGLLKMLGRLIGENITLAFVQREGLWKVHLDPTQVDQVLANLAVNARDAIGGVGQVTIRTDNVTFAEPGGPDLPLRLAGEFVLLEVQDTGCGMSQEVLDNIFEPFFTTKGVGQGTGLGLATVYGIVKQNEGFIEVDSGEDRGSTFRIYLPRHRGETPVPITTEEELPLAKGESILVVEDESTNLETLEILLLELGYRVLAAHRPSEALGLLANGGGGIQLLLTDVIMPEMNGRELADRARALHPELKCLYMSGYTADAIAHHGVLQEGVDFIAKPFTLEQLAFKIRATLDRA